jgi:hypothetical protein
MYGGEGKNICMVANEVTLRNFVLPESKSTKNTSKYVKTCGLSGGIRFRCVCRRATFGLLSGGVLYFQITTRSNNNLAAHRERRVNEQKILIIEIRVYY